MLMEDIIDETFLDRGGLGFEYGPPKTFGSQTAGATCTGPATIAATKPSIALIPT
jgi:hypothetical protein